MFPALRSVLARPPRHVALRGLATRPSAVFAASPILHSGHAPDPATLPPASADETPDDREFRLLMEQEAAAQAAQKRARELKKQQAADAAAAATAASRRAPGRFQSSFPGGRNGVSAHSGGGGGGGGRRLINASQMVRVTDANGVLQVFGSIDEANAAARAGGNILRQISDNPVTYLFQKRPDIVRNEQITYPVLQVISETGENLGQLRFDEALRRATSIELDLVLVSENPPVARIVHYGKYRMEQKAKKAAHTVARVKQVRFGAFSEDHDIETRFNQVVKFLDTGKQVRLLVYFKRPRDFDLNGAMATLEYLKSQLQTHAATDGKPNVMPGKGVSMMFSPKKKTQ